jgi:hypothetical protein
MGHVVNYEMNDVCAELFVLESWGGKMGGLIAREVSVVGER